MFWSSPEIRRAISAAYAALFHFILTQAADSVVGARYRGEVRYALANRSVSRVALRGLCLAVAKPVLPERLRPHVSAQRFGTSMRLFGGAFPQRQDRRHEADYDPSVSFVRADAEVAIAAARGTIELFLACDGGERQAFLARLLFAGRGRG
jgi:hypothetical protein